MTVELKEAVKGLSELIPFLDEKNQTFAKSLIYGPYGYMTRGSLTPKQIPYIYSLLETAMGTGEKETLNVDLGPINALFQKAKEKIKYPKIVLETPAGHIEIWIQGDKAKHQGSVAIKVDGYWIGRILTTGEFSDGLQFGRLEKRQEILQILKEFSADPAGVAAHYGKLQGSCCFCRKALATPESLEVGYGPVCAKNFQLPWGLVKFNPLAS